MGQRMATLRRLASPAPGCRIIVATPTALRQRVPSRASVAGAALVLRRDAEIDEPALEAWLHRAGYTFEARVDAPGDAALRGNVLKVFPAGASAPLRWTFDEEGVLGSIRRFDPLSQRSEAEVGEEMGTIVLDPASELVLEDAGVPRAPAVEHWLPDHHAGPLEMLLDHLPPAVSLSLDAGVEDRLAAFVERVRDAHGSRSALLRFEGAAATAATDVTDDDAAELAAPLVPLAPERLYELDLPIDALLKQPAVLRAGDATGALPSLATLEDADAAFGALLQGRLAAGMRVVLAAAVARDVGALVRRAGSLPGLEAAPTAAPDWAACVAAAPGALLTLLAPLEAGFEDTSAGILVITARNVLGGRAALDAGPTRSVVIPFAAEIEAPRPGDAVVHLDHGMAALLGLEEVAGAEPADGARDALQLEFSGGSALLVPAESMGRIWRYGADPTAVTLDRLDSEVWPRRRAEVETAIGETARRLAAMATARAARTAPRIAPPAAAMARFAARFAYPETPDQARAIRAVLEDLAAGHPMDRLIVGDVGYGKTEVA